MCGRTLKAFEGHHAVTFLYALRTYVELARTVYLVMFLPKMLYVHRIYIYIIIKL
jgi:hypothetical protein